MHVEIWQWLLIGIALCVFEIFIPSFTVLWFGLGAFVVASFAALFSPSLTAELVVWAISTSALAAAWFRYFKPRMLDRTNAGISREAAVGQIGTIIKPGAEHVRGIVRFSVPLLGQDEWPYICEAQLAAGDRCKVIDVLGNSLLVEKF